MNSENFLEMANYDKICNDLFLYTNHPIMPRFMYDELYNRLGRTFSDSVLNIEQIADKISGVFASLEDRCTKKEIADLYLHATDYAIGIMGGNEVLGRQVAKHIRVI